MKTLENQYRESKANETGLAFMLDYFAQVSLRPIEAATLYLKRQAISASDNDVRGLMTMLGNEFKSQRMAGN